MSHKSGFVNILGNTNVGKSTLMNALIGEKLSVITSKAQTTRHRILGILSGDDFQMIFSDTPGIIKPAYKLQDAMLRAANSAFEDADVIIYVSDVVENQEKNPEILEKMNTINIPTLIVLNKIDLIDINQINDFKKKWNTLLPKAEFMPVSALENKNVDLLREKLLGILPEGPAYFPKDQLTDRSARFFVSEIIREKILLQYRQEIPYSTEIVIEEFKEKEDITLIRAVIFVLRQSQKGIIIGHKGKAIKNVGIKAREDIEAFLGQKVFLELFVKVKSDWRDNPSDLARFGY